VSFEVVQPVKAEVLPIAAYTAVDMAQIGTQLGACLAVQRTYGKQGGDIEAMTRVFISDLKSYPSEKVVKALADWRLKSPDFPTPADVVELLSPQPVWSAAVFQELVERRKKGQIMSYSEEEYIKGYRKHAMSGV
jgi:hypothetical protein